MPLRWRAHEFRAVPLTFRCRARDVADDGRVLRTKPGETLSYARSSSTVVTVRRSEWMWTRAFDSTTDDVFGGPVASVSECQNAEQAGAERDVSIVRAGVIAMPLLALVIATCTGAAETPAYEGPPATARAREASAFR